MFKNLKCAVVASLTLPLAACGLPEDSAATATHKAKAVNDPVQILVLSNRADLLSNGDALIEVLLPAGSGAGTLEVDVDGRDVSSDVQLRGNGRVMGVVTGLPVGSSLLTARLPDGHGATIDLENHPVGGPIFAGPQIQPWVCNADIGVVDEQCNAPTTFELMYKSAVTQQFAAYDPASPPSDLANTTTDAGKTVPYIVRVETGTRDRGIYKLAVLFDPSENPSPWSPPAAWNGKLMYLFGGGTAPHHSQDASPAPLDDNALRNGYMVATSGLNVHGSNSNDNVSAEMVMMVKEHISENYGEIKYTIGEGCSGGGNQQYLIATQYPGVLDGIMPTCSYPDLHTPAVEVYDCVMMNRYFTQTSPQLWAVVQQQADVMGHSSIGPCQSWEALFGARLDPTVAGGCNLPADQVYHPDTNPEGTRCLIYDYQVSVLGRRDPSVWGPVEQRIGRGFANRDISSVGVQYGLLQLKANTILAEQFVDLNEKIGGMDPDGVFIPGRMKADPGAVANSFRGGHISDPRQLAKVPIIDLRGHDDAEIHTDDWSYVQRARLDRDLGHHENMIIFTGAVPLFGDPAFSCSDGSSASLGSSSGAATPAEVCTHNPLLLMARWLDAVKADTSSDPLATKIVRNKPSDAVDTCFIGGQPVTDAAVCAAAYPYYSNPVVQAGGPFTSDTFDCQLKPLDMADYAGITPAMTEAQFARLQAVFPNGVCDWSKPDADNQPSVPWLTYKDGPGGEPLGDAPVSQPFVPAAPVTPGPVTPSPVGQFPDGSGRFGGSFGLNLALLLLLPLFKSGYKRSRRRET